MRISWSYSSLKQHPFMYWVVLCVTCYFSPLLRQTFSASLFLWPFLISELQILGPQRPKPVSLPTGVFEINVAVGYQSKNTDQSRMLFSFHFLWKILIWERLEECISVLIVWALSRWGLLYSYSPQWSISRTWVTMTPGLWQYQEKMEEVCGPWIWLAAVADDIWWSSVLKEL